MILVHKIAYIALRFIGTDRLLWKDLPVFKQDINQNIIEECER